MEENGLIDLRNERLTLERRHRRLIELYEDDVIDRIEFDREVQRSKNRLRGLGPVEVSTMELTIEDFERLSSDWRLAMPEEKNDILRPVVDRAYVRVPHGATYEDRAQRGISLRFEAVGITKPPGKAPGDSSLVIGDPDGIRTHDLHRDRVAC
jgi:hypothetical protein